MGGGDPPGQNGPRTFGRGTQRRASGLSGRRDHSDAANGSFRLSFAQRADVAHCRLRFCSRSCRAWLRQVAGELVRGNVPRRNDERGDGRCNERQRERCRTPLGEPIMSSFHAAYSLGGAAGALLGGWLGETAVALGLLGPALLSSLLVAVTVPFLAREGGGFSGAGFAAPSRRLLPLAALAFVLMATEGAVGEGAELISRARAWRRASPQPPTRLFRC